nr:protein CURVATURE THYLAKOID 1A, chloroplastic-like [Ipomoea batatas]
MKQLGKFDFFFFFHLIKSIIKAAWISKIGNGPIRWRKASTFHIHTNLNLCCPLERKTLWIEQKTFVPLLSNIFFVNSQRATPKENSSGLMMASAASTSMAATAVFSPRFAVYSTPNRRCALPYPPLPRVSVHAFSAPLKLKEPKRSSLLQVKASSSEDTSIDANELFTDLKEKWDALENKSTVLLYGGGAIVAVWLASTLVGAINSVPLLPKIMELVGLGYTGWFVYRYLLFKSRRKELAEDIEVLKKKISGFE